MTGDEWMALAFLIVWFITMNVLLVIWLAERSYRRTRDGNGET